MRDRPIADWVRAVSPLLVGLVVASFAPGVRAEPHRIGKGGDIGLGGSLGDPSGVTFKWFGHPNHALEAAAGWGPIHLGGGRVHVSYLWHPRPIKDDVDYALFGYVGIGLGVAFWAKSYVGPGSTEKFRHVSGFFRAPVLGLAFHFKNLPMDVFVEAAYSPLVAPPVTYWNVDVALGARYWF